METLKENLPTLKQNKKMNNLEQNSQYIQTDVGSSLPFRHRLANVIQSFICVAENLIVILTFSSIMPRWTMNWILFRMGKGRRWFWG